MSARRCLLALLMSATTTMAGADVVTDGTVGPAVNVSGPDFLVDETLGTLSGDNLFHSFSVFDVYSGETVTFAGPVNVRNVVGRVTGGNLSTIDGGVINSISGADLWLINPAGMVFGSGAWLDVQGSVYVSTADGVRFADGTQFGADISIPSNTSFTVMRLHPDWSMSPVRIRPAPMVSVMPEAWSRL